MVLVCPAISPDSSRVATGTMRLKSPRATRSSTPVSFSKSCLRLREQEMIRLTASASSTAMVNRIS